MQSPIRSGTLHAAEQLLPLVYDELRKLAAAKLAHEKRGGWFSGKELSHVRETPTRTALAVLAGGDEFRHGHRGRRGEFAAAAAGESGSGETLPVVSAADV
jgi:hypothetical protein